jgi:hypothetical protein
MSKQSIVKNLSALCFLLFIGAAEASAQNRYFYSFQTGNWNTTTTWRFINAAVDPGRNTVISSGAAGVPNAVGDFVRIGAGHIITHNVGGLTISELVVNDDAGGGTHRFDNTGRTLTISGNLTINSGGVVETNASAALGNNNPENHTLTVTGDLSNAGTLDGREADGSFFDNINITIGGNLSGAGVFDLNNLTFNGTTQSVSVTAIQMENNLTVNDNAAVTISSGTITVGNVATNVGTITLNTSAAAPHASLTINSGADVIVNGDVNNATFEMQQASLVTVDGAGSTLTIAPNVTNNNNVARIFAGIDAANQTTLTVSNGGAVTIGTGTFGDFIDVTANTFQSITVSGTGSTLTANGTGGTLDVESLSVTGGATATFRNSVSADGLTVTGSTLNIGTTTAGTLTLNAVTAHTMSGAFNCQTEDLTIADGASLTVSTGTLTVGTTATNTGTITLNTSAAAPHASLTINSGADVIVNGDVNNATFEMQQASLVTVDGAGSTLTIAPNVTNNNNVARIFAGIDAANQTTLTVSNGGAVTIGTGTFGDFIDVTANTFQSITVSGTGSTLTANGNQNVLDIESITVTGGATATIANVLTVDGNSTVSGAGSQLNIATGFTTTGGNLFTIRGGAVFTIDGGGTVRVGQNLTDVTAGNQVQLTNSTLNIDDGTMTVAGVATNLTSAAFANLFNVGGNSFLNIGDNAGGAGSAVLNLAPNLAAQLPTPATRNLLDLDGTGTPTVRVRTDGLLQVGGGNIGNVRLQANGALFENTGGTVNITASMQLNNGGTRFNMTGGTANIGTSSSNGGNSIILPNDVGGGSARLTISGGTVNVGDGNTNLGSGSPTGGGFGNGNNDPAFASANFISLELSGTAVFNLNGRFLLNDGNARLIMSGNAAFNINPTGDQDLTGTQSACNLNRGIVQMSGGTLTIVNPTPNAGTGVAFRTSPLGDPGSDANLTGSTSLPSENTCFTGGSTIRFGDGVSTASGSSDGFDVNLAPSHTYRNFTVNNPSGSNRFVSLFTTPANSTINLNDLTLTAGEIRQGLAVTSPSTLVSGTGVLTLGANTLYNILSTATGSPFPNFGSIAANYVIDVLNTVEYSGAATGGQTITIPASGVQFGSLTVSGSGTRTVSAGNAVRRTFRLSDGLVNIGAGNLTMVGGSRVLRAGTDAAGIILTGNTFNAASGDYTIEYQGVNKTTRPEEFSGTGNKSLTINVTVGQTVTLDATRTAEANLALTSGNFSDGGFILNVGGNVSGTANGQHNGTSGRIRLNGTAAQQFSGTVIVQNLELNNAAGATLAVAASVTINGVYTPTAGIFDIGDQLLTFGLSASVAGTPSASNMIRLSGTPSALGVRKGYQAGTNFLFPVGVGTKYTPARINLIAATGSDFVTLKPINAEAPTNSTANALQYHWIVSQGPSLSVTQVTHFYQYLTADASEGVETSYVPGRNELSLTNWTLAGTSADVQENTDVNGNPAIGFGRIVFTTQPYIDGYFTAGESPKFSNGSIEAYYSVPSATGEWGNPGSWRIGSFAGSPAVTPPGIDNPVIIGSNGTITVTNAAATTVPSTTIQATGTLTFQGTGMPTTSFGTVSGEGLLRITTDDNPAAFPVGTFTSFLGTTGGTVEYGGSFSYTLPATVSTYRNLIISGSGSTKTFADVGLLSISGNLTVQGGVLAQLSSTTDGDLWLSGAAAGGGNLTVTGTGSILRFMNNNERAVFVANDVTIGAGAAFDVATTGTPVENSLNIGSATGGNLTNNGTFDMSVGGGRLCNVTFTGASNTSITGTGATTDFNRLIVNKGSSQAFSLFVNAPTNFTLSATNVGPNKALSLVNGTFRYNYTSGTLELNAGNGDFVIPATAALQIDAGTVQVSATSGANDLRLRGGLIINGGTVNIGTDPSGTTQNSIVYETATAALTVNGGTLTVGTGIRSSGAGTDALNYTQSGGTVTVGRFAVENGFAVFGITGNAGSQFNMTGAGATLNIVRGGNTANTVADLAIGNVPSPTTPAGTIQIFTGDTPATPIGGALGLIYNINSNVRLPNVNVGNGGTINFNIGSQNGGAPQFGNIRGNLTVNLGGTGQLRFFRINGATNLDVVNPIVGGNFVITNGDVRFGDATSATVSGNFTQNGGVVTQGTTNSASLSIGGNFLQTAGTFNTALNTTFNGTTTPQTIQRTGGSPATLTFINFTLNNTAISGTVQPLSPINITGNWTTTAGTFDATTNAQTVTFNGTAPQTITGTTDFYNLTIANASGVTMVSGTLGIRNTNGSGGTLTLTSGILDIGANLLIIRNTDATGVIGGTPSASNMIRTNGLVSAAGVTKVYGGAQSFTFPIGTTTIYTPATINVTNLGTGGAGSITVAPVTGQHPQAASATGRILYYWRTTQSGFAEESTGFSVTHTYTATTAVSNLGGTLANYVGAFYIGAPTFQWRFLPNPPGTPDPNSFDESNFTIGAPTAATTNRITGDFTAGEGLINPIVYYSFRSGNWDVVTGIGTTTWSTDPVTEIPPGSLPNSGTPVVIRNGHEVNTNGNNRLSATLTFDSNPGGTLVISNNSSGHNFGTVIVNSVSPGTIRFDQNASSTPNFPTATFDVSFLTNGTIEYGGTGTYTMPTGGSVPAIYPNLTFSGSGTKTTVATSLSGNLAINGSVTVDLNALTLNRTTVGGTMSMAAGTTLLVEGAPSGGNNFPANFTTYTLDPTSTVVYDPNAANQTIASLGGQPYGNLTIGAAGGAQNRTLTGATVVAGNLTFLDEKTLITNNFDLTIGGNLSLNAAASAITPGTSTITFNGAGVQTFAKAGGGSFTFNNLTLNKPSGSVNVSISNTSITVTNALALTGGTLNIGAASASSLTLNGTVSGSGLLSGTTANSDLTINGTGALGTLTFAGGGQGLRRFTVNRTASGTLTLGSNLTVGQGTGADSLYLLNGVIFTGANTLTLANQAQFGHGSASAYIDGELAITYPTALGVARFFPIAGAGNYRPVSVSGNSTSGAVVGVRMINSTPPGSPGAGLNNISSVRYYQLTRSGVIASPRVTLSFNTTSNDEGVTNPSGLRVASTIDNPPTGSSIWQAGTSPSATITTFPAGFASSDIASVATNSPVFVVLASTTTDNPLPVELTSFIVRPIDDGVSLKWETASETDNAGFILERATVKDGDYTEIASYRDNESLRGLGTSPTGKTYEYIDKSRLVAGATYFYKLKDVDLQGRITEHEIKEIKMPNEYALSQNYPNPFNPTTTIEFSLNKSGMTRLEIYNVLGQKVATVVNGELAAGSYRYQVNASNLASGVYFYRLQSRDFVATKKMMLVK